METADLTIKVEHRPEAELATLGVKRWPIWEHDPGRAFYGSTRARRPVIFSRAMSR